MEKEEKMDKSSWGSKDRITVNCKNFIVCLRIWYGFMNCLMVLDMFLSMVNAMEVNNMFMVQQSPSNKTMRNNIN